jgi:hypothetical protein
MVKKDYRIEIAGMGYPINTPSQKARAREMMRVSRIRVVSVYARTPPSSFYSLTGRKFRAERPAGRRTVAAVRPNGAKMHTVRPIPGHGMRAAIVPTDDAVVYVTALRRAAGAELGNYIRDVYPVLSSEARSLRDKIAAAGEHEAVDIRAEIPRDGGWATNRVHHGKYVRPNGACRPAAKKAAPKRASRSNGVRSPSYPYLVVERMTGRVHAGRRNPQRRRGYAARPADARGGLADAHARGRAAQVWPHLVGLRRDDAQRIRQAPRSEVGPPHDYPCAEIITGHALVLPCYRRPDGAVG